MANRADGSVVIDTSLDNSGVEIGAKEMERRINSLSTSVNRLGERLKKAAAGYSDGVNEVLSRSFSNNIEGVRAKLEALGKAKIPTEEYRRLSEDVEKTGKKLEDLLTRQEKLEETGVSKNSAQWKSLQYDIDQTGKKYDDLVMAQERMKANGSAFTSGSETEEYRRLNRELTTLENGMKSGATHGQVFSTALKGLAHAIKTVAEHALSLGKRFAQIGFNVITTGAKKAASGLKSFVSIARKAVSSLKSLKGQTHKADLSTLGLVKSLTSLKRLLITRVKRMFISAIFNNVKEGIQQLAKFSSAFDKQMSNMKNSATRLSGNIAVLIGSIISVVEPVITRIINLMAQGVDWINQFIAMLQGKSTYTSAAMGAQSYADSVNDAAKAQKKLNRELYSFDEMNRQSGNDDDNNSNSSSINYENKPVDLPSAITDWIDRLKEAWKNGDWSGVGQVIADGINAVFSKLDDLISWENIGDTISRIVNGITDLINSAVKGVNWEKIGRTFGSGVNTMVNTLYLFFTGIDWTAIGKALASGLNGLVGRVDWDMLGRLFGAKINALFDTIRGFVRNFKWSDAGTAFANMVNSLKNEVNWFTLGDSLKGLLKGAIALMQYAVKTIEWGDAGTKFAEALNAFFARDSLWADAGNTIDTTIKGLLDFTEKAIITFDEVQFADDLKALFGNVDWDGIARNTWNLMKIAFQKMGSFVNALLNEQADTTQIQNRGDSFYGKQVEEIMNFNKKTIGAKLGIRLREAFEDIPWDDIASGIWRAAKEAFGQIEDFLINLLGIDEAEITRLGSKTKAIGVKIGNAIASIDWAAGFEVVKTSLLTFLDGAISGLVGSESDNPGNGTVFAIIAGSLLVLKAGLVKGIASVTGAVIGAIGTNLPAIADGLLLLYDFSTIKDAADGYAAAGEAYNRTVKTYVDGYTQLLKDGNKEAADEYAAQVAQIDTTGMSMEEAIWALKMKASAQWGDAPKDWKEAISQGWNNYFGENGRGFINLVGDGVDSFLSWLGVKEPEIQYAADQAFTIDFEGQEELFRAHGEKAAGARADGFISKTEEKKDEIKQANADAFVLPSPEELAQMGMFDADSGADGFIQEAEVRTPDIEKATKDMYSIELVDPGKTSGESYMNGVQEGVKDNTEATKNTVAGAMNAISGVVNSGNKKVASDFSGTYASVEKNTSKSLGSMTDNVSRTIGKTIPNVVRTGADAYAATIKTGNEEAQENADDHNKSMVSTFTTMFSGIVTSAAAMVLMNATVTLGMNTMKTTVNTALDAISKKFTDTWDSIKTTTSDALNNVVGSITGRDWTGAGNAIVDGIRGGFDSRWPGMQNDAQNSAEGLRDAIAGVYWYGVGDDIVSHLQDGMFDNWRYLVNTAENLADDLKFGVENQDWWSVGDHIVAGIQEGVKDNWKWLERTVRNLADSLFKAAKDQLGISSPSKVFAQIGTFVDAGLQQGLEDGERDVLQTAANIAEAVSNEMSPDNPKVDVTAEGVVSGMQAVISGLSGVAETFKVILDTIRSMGGLVVPQIAAGTVVPYKTRVSSASTDNADIIDTLETLNDDLESVIIQSVNNAVVALVEAIQNSGGGDGTSDVSGLTSRVIEEINRRARAQRSSPVIV